MRSLAVRLILLLLLFAPAAINGQSFAHAVFDGTWVLDQKKSSGPANAKGSTLEITSSSDAVTIVRKYKDGGKDRSYQLQMYIDGRGEVNPLVYVGSSQTQAIRSKTVWSKDKLVREYVTQTDPPMFSIYIKEVYRLSKDGKQLVLEITQRSDLPVASPFPLKLVYNR